MFDIDGTLVNTADFEDSCYLKAVQNVIPGPINQNWSSYSHATDSGILDEIIHIYDLDDYRDAIHYEVKRLFIRYIKSHLQQNGAVEIAGASAFIRLLRHRSDVALAIATGGWEETAKLKLESAGIDYRGMAFASGTDHTSRIDIMKLAEERVSVREFTSKTYFGDAVWDKEASISLAYNFILVGDGFYHAKQIPDFNSSEKVLSIIGLKQVEKTCPS